MAAGTKKGKKRRRKRQLQKRFKQTSGTVLVSIEPPKEFKAHLLYEGKYLKENEQYQQQLDVVYNGTVTPIERFVNQKSILVHRCSECNNKFYGKPLFLVNGVQPHNCKSSGIVPNKPHGKSSAKKKDHKIKTDEKKSAELAKELDELIEQGLNPRQIRNKTGVDIQIITYYKETFHTKKTAGLG